MNSIEMPLLKVPIISEVHAQARQFAAQQVTPQKGKQVYLNTLAVYAVHNYLKWMGYETNLEQSESWQPDWQVICDVADLVVPEVGKLECRPVLPGETVISLPPEVTEDRIGYVAVKFGDRLDQVELLGFTPAVNTEDVPAQLRVADLQPLETVLDRLEELQSQLRPAGVEAVRQQAAVVAVGERLVNLSQWLQNVFEEGWQTVEALLGAEKANLAFRSAGAVAFRNSSIKRAKQINLEPQLAGSPVVLLVAFNPVGEQQFNTLLQVHPHKGQTYLPENLQLTVLDDLGVPVADDLGSLLQAQARNADNYIQLQLYGQQGEYFYVQITLGDISVTKDFVI
jgi:hypothetical protein